METAKLSRFLGKQGGSNRRKIVSFSDAANGDTGNSPTPSATMTLLPPAKKRTRSSIGAPQHRLFETLVRAAVETRFGHRSTDLGVRGSTPHGRANFFKTLVTADGGRRNGSNFCGPPADLSNLDVRVPRIEDSPAMITGDP
jgi:hypothetical protein